MSPSAMTPAQANMDLTLLNAEAESISSSDLYLWLRESGLPSEVAIRLKGLVDMTANVANRTIAIGKIIILKIIEFVKAHPNLAIGIALGAAIGALVLMVPFLGPLLAPFTVAIGATLGALAGQRLDSREKGDFPEGSPLISIPQDAIEVAKAFFQLLIDIFNTVFAKLTEG